MPGEAAARREGWWALALAAAAALRILGFSLAFPFFTNVDEYRHFDVVLKYARGEIPRPGPDRYEPDLAWWVGSFGSPEYHRDPDAPAGAELPRPVWLEPPEVGAARVAQLERYLGERHSLEADQPPLYYAAAGGWLALGRALGLEGALLLYWVRALGAAAGAATVGLAWLLLRDLYPQSALVRLGAPLLLAALPQDWLFYLTSDAFSPLVGGLAFLLALRLAARPGAPTRAYAAAGLVAAAGFLTKFPNAALGAAALVASAASLAGAGAWRARAPRWALYWACFLLPAAGWLLRNWVLGGDLTATAFKVQKLGWVPKAFAAWWDHPLFTPAGAVTFVRHLLPTFWRGELVWQRETLAWPPADALYGATTLLFLALALFGLRRRERPRAARVSEAAAACAVAAGVSILGALSLLFHFPERANPSAGFPFFVEGRLISGVSVPFALLYARGVEVAAAALPGAWRARAGFACLGAVALLALASELWLARPVFASPYNGFHLP
jgi:hypothetical protein